MSDVSESEEEVKLNENGNRSEKAAPNKRYLRTPVRTPKSTLERRKSIALVECEETKCYVDPKLVRSLALIQCTYQEMAATIGCSKTTLEKHFKELINKCKEEGKQSLRRKMFDNAINNNNTQMQIFLSKNELGYTDKQEVKQDTTLTINISE